MSQMCGRDAGIAAECLVWGKAAEGQASSPGAAGQTPGCSFLAISLNASGLALHFKRPTESSSDDDNPNAGIPPGSR